MPRRTAALRELERAVGPEEVSEDPLTLALSALILLSVSALACAAPAWRASRVDPRIALDG